MSSVLVIPPLMLSLSLPFINIGGAGVKHFGGFIFFKEGKEGQEYLLMKHAETGLWGLPGGTLEENESVSEAALRETFEETGWTNNEEYEANFKVRVHFKYKDRNGMLNYVHLFPAILTNHKSKLKLSEEHSEYDWMDYDEAIRTIQPDYKEALYKGDGFIRAYQELNSKTET